MEQKRKNTFHKYTEKESVKEKFASNSPTFTKQIIHLNTSAQVRTAKVVQELHPGTCSKSWTHFSYLFFHVACHVAMIDATTLADVITFSERFMQY